MSTTAALAAVGALVLLRLLLGLRTRRPDGVLLPTPPVRRMMFTIMPTRNESVVYFDAAVDARPLLGYLPLARAAFGADMTHCVVAACEIGLASTPRMNRFVIGRRLYQRTGRSVTFAMKRGLRDGVVDRRSSLATVKLRTDTLPDFPALVAAVDAQISENRSGRRTAADQEYALFNLLPRGALDAAAGVLRWLDHHNLLPGFFIAGDPLYTSMFVANLGSLKMGAGYHHLYEYGTCPLFLMVGQVEDRVVVGADGAPTVIPVLPLRFSFDERIDDGLNARHGMDAVCRVLADPARWLGGVDPSGADRRPLWPRDDWASADGFYAARD